MRDRVFYPLFVVVALAIIALALAPGLGRGKLNPAEIAKKGYVLQGADLQKLAAAPATLIRSVTGADGTALARLSTNIPRDLAPKSAGVFGTLGPNFEQAFGGRRIEISVTARSAPENPLDRFKLGYFTSGAGDSGWRDFVLTPKFKDYSFTFTPARPDKPGNDYIGIWPGDEGDGSQMDVKSIRIRITD